MRAFRSKAVLALALLGLAGPVRGVALGIDPILIELSPAAPTVLLSLRNEGSEPARFQLTAFDWAQNAKGQMQLAPTSEIVLFPPLLEIAPGEKRNIRVGTTAAFGRIEKTFRVLVDELPPLRRQGSAPGLGVGTLGRVSLPVFLSADKAVEDVRIDGLRVERGLLRFRLRNAGTVHARPRTIRVEAVGPGGEKVFAHDWSGWYLLAGGEREYEVQVPAGACVQARSFTVQAMVDPSVVRASFESGGAGCAR